MKVESERWYYWADVLGLLIWQDQVAGDYIRYTPPTPGYKQNFKRELIALVTGPRKNHPSIVRWTIFNEGWGQPKDNFTTEMVALVKSLDSSRLISCASGWTDYPVGDVVDVHNYPEPRAPTPDKLNNRQSVVGEYGGALLIVENSQWAVGKCHGYVQAANPQALATVYAGWTQSIAKLKNSPGLSGSVYTQLTDVETECNGLLTYDRIFKVSPDLIKAANLAVLNA